MNEILLGGRKIAYRSAGRGRPLVLLHGGAEDGRAWRLQVEGLADEFEVIAWDARSCTIARFHRAAKCVRSMLESTLNTTPGRRIAWTLVP